MAALQDYRWKPKSVEESVDAGVHPAVAAMRRKAASVSGSRTVEDAIAGRSVLHIIGQNKAPSLQVDKLSSDPTYNPMNFFKQSAKLGVNPLKEVILSGRDGPSLPDGKEEKMNEKKAKKDKKRKSEKKKGKKKKKAKSSSSASSSSDSSSSQSDKKKKRKRKKSSSSDSSKSAKAVKKKKKQKK